MATQPGHYSVMSVTRMQCDSLLKTYDMSSEEPHVLRTFNNGEGLYGEVLFCVYDMFKAVMTSHKISVGYNDSDDVFFDRTVVRRRSLFFECSEASFERVMTAVQEVLYTGIVDVCVVIDVLGSPIRAICTKGHVYMQTGQ